jgi:hypothetical protein
MIRVIQLLVLALSVCSTVYAQPLSAEKELAAGIKQMHDGDAFLAIFTLNGVVSQLAGRPDASAMLARTHAYRASAYIELGQPERAMAAALLALKADPKIVVAPPDFSAAVVKLFADPAGFAAAKPADSSVTLEPVKTAAAPVAPMVPAMAAIYLYRPGHYVGSAGKAKVLCDGQTVAELQNGRVVVVKAAPGAHHLKVGGKDMPLVTEGGRDYYIEVAVQGFGWSAKRMEPDTAAAEVRDKKMKLNDPGRTFSTECAVGTAPPAFRR